VSRKLPSAPLKACETIDTYGVEHRSCLAYLEGQCRASLKAKGHLEEADDTYASSQARAENLTLIGMSYGENAHL
jgi:hypothetical protein